MKLSILLPALILLAGCQTKTPATAERTITVTLEPQRYFAEQLAGHKFTVVSMVPHGSSPETYDPTPQQLVELARSEAYLRIGHIGFEQAWMEKLAANAPQLQIFNTSEGIDFVAGEAHGHEGHHTHTGMDPHVWNSPANARLLARNTCQALCHLDSANTAYYTRRLDSLNHVIDRTDSTIRALLAQAPARSFVIYHPALTYYARDYGLQQLCIENHGKEPSAAHLQQLIDRCRREGTRVVFVQKEFDVRNAEILAKEIGARLVQINPLDYQWDKELIRTTQALARHE